MQLLVFSICLAMMHLQAVHMAAIEIDNGETSLHFDFKTENGQQRVEDVKFDKKRVATKSAEDLKHPGEVNMNMVEFRGGYSFVSADGYEYTVKYKANKNGFQPYVTAYKLRHSPSVAL